MRQLDVITPNLKRASERWSEAKTLLEHYRAIDTCYKAGGFGLVDHVKSFLECACVTILHEYGLPLPSSSPSTTELLVAALKPLGLQNARGASKLDKVLSGFNKLSDALLEMRNEHGPLSHGKDGFLDVLSLDHSRAFLFTTDAILGVILAALDGTAPNLLHTRAPYGAFEHLCEQIDLRVGMSAAIDQDGETPVLVINLVSAARQEPIELRLSVSKLLFGVDRQAFIEVMNEAALAALKDSRSTTEKILSDAIFTISPDKIGSPEAQKAEPKKAYSGRFAPLAGKLSAFLIAESIDPQAKLGTITLQGQILHSIDEGLGIDWHQRESLRAKVKVAVKRLLVRGGTETDKAESVAEKLITWMIAIAPEINALEGGAGGR